MPTPATNPEAMFKAGAIEIACFVNCPLEHVSDAVVVVDQDWRCLYSNASFERMVCLLRAGLRTILLLRLAQQE